MAARGSASRASEPKAPAMAIDAGYLVVAGILVTVWFAVWGTHGCDETDACFARMDRDFRLYLIRLVGLGLGLGGFVALLRFARAETGVQPLSVRFAGQTLAGQRLGVLLVDEAVG
jgi:hypothetical protein